MQIKKTPAYYAGENPSNHNTREPWKHDPKWKQLNLEDHIYQKGPEEADLQAGVS